VFLCLFFLGPLEVFPWVLGQVCSAVKKSSEASQMSPPPPRSCLPWCGPGARRFVCMRRAAWDADDSIIN
jgi:hypothetical protein